MDRLWQKASVKYPWYIIAANIIIIGIVGWYASGLFGSLSSDDGGFYADPSLARQADEQQQQIFGARDTSTTLVLFEQKDASIGTADSQEYQDEVARLLEPLEKIATSSATYRTTGAESFISNDKKATYAVVKGAKSYDDLKRYADNVDQSKLKVSLGGSVYGSKQTQEQVKVDLLRAELVTLPLLLVLLVIFFRSVIAALIPLIMSAITIVGAFAIARFATSYVSIDEYAINVITILGLGLSVDYSLLIVNRFREELRGGANPSVATQKTLATAGRTVVFSGLTVAVCLLSLLLFPVTFLHSIAVGGASAVIVAVLVSILLLPAVLRLLGDRINRWRVMPQRHNSTNSQGGIWWRIAHNSITRPAETLIVAAVLIGLVLIPLVQFKVGSFDYRWLANNQSAQYVGKQLDTQFGQGATSASALLKLSSPLTVPERLALSCDTSLALENIDGVASVRHALPTDSREECMQLATAAEMGQLPPILEESIASYTRPQALLFDVELNDPSGSHEAALTIERLRSQQFNGTLLLVGGEPASVADTTDAYMRTLPAVVLLVVVGMCILLSLLLRSIILPIQAVVINTIAIFISLSLIVGVFQLGWGESLGFSHVAGLDPAAPILVAAIAFGLAMDYSVFLYSRMREVYDKTKRTDVAIEQGVVVTGPIITAAALMFFVVVVAFAFSQVAFMQIIGFGLATAVLIDAFIVRLILVPAIMRLMGKLSWYAPAWLSRWTIRHD